MAKKSSPPPKQEKPQMTEQAEGLPPIPDGLDEGIFRQGFKAAEEAAQFPEARLPQCPFEINTHQYDAWTAGYAAFIAPPEGGETEPEF